MVILIIISNAGIGGAQRVAMNLAAWMNRQEDVRAEIIALSHTFGETYDIPNLIQLNGKKITSQLRNEINRLKADAVISMGVPMSIYTVPACFGTKAKHIVSERNDPKHFAGKISVKIISRALMRLADGFVFQTEDAKKYYRITDNRKTAVIHNPLANVESIPYKSVSGKKELVTAGRLVSQKNQRLLIEAFNTIHEAHPEYKLTIWGEGPERGRLEELVAKLGLEGEVNLPGAVSDILDKISESAIFVLPSDFEGMPNALMEAMAEGLPCISTACPCGGPEEIIEDHLNGILIPVGDKKALEKALFEIIEDETLALTIGNNALNIRESHNIDIISNRWLEFIKNIVKGQ